ncbi:Regulatory protein ArsR [Nitrosopumilaceae archaeon]|nr:helix-turn-helix domain-containing protein [Nitrosopumilus sp.]MDA7955333.1 helix-turn-helix domain-containing protein [Nitrosopumilus sp.]MDA7973709.1 helix-turn-helix domain-containing protein [Nitrosopumilus sp.]CAI9831800.1 Regulatory protein ArsR [Nitrosopumilaceae archaeon]
MELSSEVAEPRQGGTVQPSSRRVRMIFSVMASPNRIEILRILNSKGPLTYSELKSLAGFKSKKESGKFAYHLRKLLKQQLVSLNRAEKRYTITNLGKLVLSLARQIEERSVIENGKMYVRTSSGSIEEFKAHKIAQSMIREGSLPMEMAEKFAQEVENRIYKNQTTYLTGPLIREMVNSVLLEHHQEEYRSKMSRLGMPVGDVAAMLSNLDGAGSGAEGILLEAGQRIFAERLLANLLPKDVADSHLSGDLHISSPGTWSLIPDTVFVNIRDLVDGGLNLGGKHLGVSRVPASRQLGDVAGLATIILSLLPREASREVVLDGLVPMLSKFKAEADLVQKITGMFAISSASQRYDRPGTVVSVRLQLGQDLKVVQAIIAAYAAYVRMTPVPRIGLVIDHEKGRVSDVSGAVSEVVSTGGLVTFAKGQSSVYGITGTEPKASKVSISLESVSVNLPRLAFESNNDETYLRARLLLLMKPVLSSMDARKKEVSDLTTRGLNPLLAKCTQYMQRSSVSISINLVGLDEAVFGILGLREEAARKVLFDVVKTASDVASKKSKELGVPISVCMTEAAGSSRLVRLDAEKYGKNAVPNAMDDGPYTEGAWVDPSQIKGMTAQSEQIERCRSLSKELAGGLLVRLPFAASAGPDDIKAAVEKAASLLPVFRPSKKVPVCGECGYKEKPFEDRCPRCKSPFLV